MTTLRLPRHGEDPDDLRRAEAILARLERAKRARSEYSKEWNTYYRYFRGKQRPPKGGIVVNLIFGMVESQVPLLTDGRPRIQLIPVEPRDLDKVEKFQQLLDYFWNKAKLDREIEKVVIYSAIFGNGFLKIFWNPRLENGLGDVEVQAISPRYVFVDPGAEDIEKAQWVIHAEPRPVEWVRETYGVPDVQADFSYDREQEWDIEKTTLMSGNRGFLGERMDELEIEDVISNVEGGVNSQQQMTWVIECWEKVMVNTTATNQEGVEITIPQQRVVKTTVLGKGSRILTPPQMMPPEITELPFASMVWYRRAGSFWGIGEVENLISPQREYNRRKSQLIQMFGLMAVGRLLNPIECGVDPDSITNEQGEIISYIGSSGLKPSVLYPAQPPGAFFQHQEEVRRDIETVAGIYDVTVGRTPRGIEAATAIAQLQEAAQVRIRLKARHLDETIQRLGEVLLEHFVAYYRATRFARVLGWDGQPQVIPINLASMLGDRAPKFDVLVESGLTLKLTRSERERRVMELYKAGVVDDIAVLEELEYPRKGALLERKYGLLGRILSDPKYQHLIPIINELARRLVGSFPEAPAGGAAPPPPSAGATPTNLVTEVVNALSEPDRV